MGKQTEITVPDIGDLKDIECDVLVLGAGPGGYSAAVSYTHLTLPTTPYV